jgi:hypothetical protein
MPALLGGLVIIAAVVAIAVVLANAPSRQPERRVSYTEIATAPPAANAAAIKGAGAGVEHAAVGVKTPALVVEHAAAVEHPPPSNSPPPSNTRRRRTPRRR